MSEFLDMRTLTFSAGLISVLLAGLMIHASLKRKVYPGFHHWTIGFMLSGLGLVLTSLRGFIPDYLTIVVANASILTFAALLPLGLAIFFDAPRMTWLGTVSLVVGVLGMIVFTYYHNDVVARVIIISLLWGALFLRGSWLTAKYARTCVGEPNHLLNGILVASALWFLVRAVLTPLMNGYIHDYMSSGIFQSISMMLGIILHIMTMFGLIGLNTQRLERDLLNADQDIQDLEKLLPICANCHKIRDDQGYWEGVETYLHQHTGVEFTHSLCPDCARKLYPELGKAKLK